MIGVIDTSALLRLFIPDGDVPAGLHAFIGAAEKGLHQAIAPELLAAEAANVVLKKQRSGALSDGEAAELLKDIMALPIRLLSHQPLVGPAYKLALQLNRTIYDALFLALAIDRGAVFFTADMALAKAARSSGIPVNIDPER
jgi:predicted nucleic acid-binding protein